MNRGKIYLKPFTLTDISEITGYHIRFIQLEFEKSTISTCSLYFSETETDDGAVVGTFRKHVFGTSLNLLCDQALFQSYSKYKFAYLKWNPSQPIGNGIDNSEQKVGLSFESKED